MKLTFQEVQDRIAELRAHPYFEATRLHQTNVEPETKEEEEILRSGRALVNQFMIDVMPEQTFEYDDPIRAELYAVIQTAFSPRDHLEEGETAPDYWARQWDGYHDSVRSVLAVRSALLQNVPINGLITPAWSDFVKAQKVLLVDN